MENSFKKRETTSIFDYEDRKFEIGSFDPMEGNYILMQILMFTLPFGISDALNEKFGTNNKTEQKTISKEDFIQLQTDILSNVNEILYTGEKTPVVRPNRTYGISDVSMMLIIKLIIATLAFNFKDFFKESQLLNIFTKE